LSGTQPEPRDGAAPDPLWRVGAVAAQLGLLVLVIGRFQIESAAFHQIALLALGGFIVHSLIPRGARLPFFLLLSFAAIGIVFGAVNGAWLVAIGLGLIGLCHLPIPFWARGAALVAAGSGLAVLRAAPERAPWSAAVWPILGAMFMFRLIVYLYDLRHEKERPNAVRTLSYFFLLPNVCFPLFPVVDFKTFRRTHYDAPPSRIYQVGIDWMLRGVTHLLLYRLIYTNFTLDPAQVRDRLDLAQFLLTNFLLYLRVSGQFHIIVGMLHLFGFNLPETNHRYALSSSFTDFWRRINIYWKDFMMKVFYYPIFFQLRRWGATFALVAATVAVFLITWALHSYQWFWIRGSFPVTAQDTLFWGALCALVVVNSLREAKHGRKRTLAARARSARETAGVALRTAGTFAAICALWALWTCDSLAGWAALWPAALASVATPAGALGTLGAVGLALGGAGAARGGAAAGRSADPFARRAALTGVALLALYGVSFRPVYSRLGDGLSGLVQSVRTPQLSRRDAAMMERGYYENLLDVNRLNTQLWEVFMKRPQWPLLYETAAGRRTHDYFDTELVPSVEIEYHGATLRTNRWAMRDREYDLAKPPHTVRIALLGSSHVMGSGVANDATFEQLLEDELNRERVGPAPAVEVLNFAVAGYSPLQQAAVLDDRALRFAPDAVLYVAHAHDREDALRRLAEMVRAGVDVRYDALRRVVRAAGIGPETPEAVARERLEPHGDAVIAWLYRHVAESSAARGAAPVWVFLPRLIEEPEEAVAWLADAARAAGLATLDLSDTYADADLATLRVAEWDHHPNAAGHLRIAGRLIRALREQGALLDGERSAVAAPGP
jgi:hypothetical protein